LLTKLPSLALLLKPPSYLIEQVDLGDGVGRVSGVLHQQRNEPDECVERVEALGADEGGSVAGAGRGFAQRAVTQVHTHLRAQAEEARDQVVRLEDALLVHLEREDEGLRGRGTERTRD
jgi:hypothetical protein